MMSDERPLRTTGTDAERLLLAAGSAEKPDARSVRRAAERLGLFPTAIVVAGAMALAWRSARWSSFVWRSILPLAGAAAIAVAYGVEHRADGVAPTAVAPSASSAPGRIDHPGAGAAAVPSPAPTAPDTMESAVLPLAPALPRISSRVGPRVPARVAPADRLREQAERLDRARALLEAGDSSGTLALLDDYDRRFAGGPLSEESLLLRIKALGRRGDRSAASALARRFLKTYPASVHVDRVTALLHSLSP
jgi:hypothetical protein